MLAIVLHHPITHALLKGALTGAGAAAVVDFNNFRAWKDWREAATYSWGLASFRWFQGGFAGAVLATATLLGLNLVS